MCPNADQASRLVIAADLQGLPVAALYKAILHAEWCEDRDIYLVRTLREIAAAQGLDADALLRAAAAPDVERRYRQYTDEAVAAARSARRRMSMPASCSGARTGWKCWKRRSRRRDAYPAATRGGICVGNPLCDALAQVPRQLRALFRLDIGKSHAQPGHGILHAEGLAMAQQPASPRHGQRHGLIVRRQRNPQIESIALRRMRQALRAQRLPGGAAAP